MYNGMASGAFQVGHPRERILSMSQDGLKILRYDTIRFCPLCGGALVRQRVLLDSKEQAVCSACGFVFYLNPKIAACTIPRVDGGAVLLRRAIGPSYGLWTFPGGFVDIGETLEDAAVRETLEEVNLQVKIDRLLNVYSYPESAVVVVVYLADVVGGELRAGIEALEVRTFRPHEIPWEALAFESTAQALRQWTDGHGLP